MSMTSGSAPTAHAVSAVTSNGDNLTDPVGPTQWSCSVASHRPRIRSSSPSAGSYRHMMPGPSETRNLSRTNAVGAGTLEVART